MTKPSKQELERLAQSCRKLSNDRRVPAEKRLELRRHASNMTKLVKMREDREKK